MSTSEQSLQRSLKPQWVFAIALGSAVGWGAFILPFDWMSSGGLGGTLIGFAIGGAMISVIAISYGAAIRALPVTGGGVAFALSALGKTHAFIAGWCLTLGYAGIVALNASATALVFRVTVPDLVMHMRLYSVAGWDVYLPEVLISLAFLAVFAWINVRGVEVSGRFQFAACCVMLAAVVIIVVCVVIAYAMDPVPLAPPFPAGTAPLAAIITIVAFAPWAYVGFDNIPQLAGEFDFSPAKALLLLLWGVAAATFIYIAMMVATSLAVADAHDAYESSAWPPAEAIADVIGPFGLALMVSAVSMGVLTGLNGFYMSASRVLFTMSRAQMLPPVFGRLSSRATPTAGIVFVLIICAIAPWFGRAALLWVVDMTSVGVTIAYFYTCFCAYRIGRTGHVPGMVQTIAPSPSRAAVGIIGCVLAAAFFLLLVVPASPSALTLPSFIALGCWLILGAALYASIHRRYSAVPIESIRESVFAEDTATAAGPRV